MFRLRRLWKAKFFMTSVQTLKRLCTTVGVDFFVGLDDMKVALPKPCCWTFSGIYAVGLLFRARNCDRYSRKYEQISTVTLLWQSQLRASKEACVFFWNVHITVLSFSPSCHCQVNSTWQANRDSEALPLTTETAHYLRNTLPFPTLLLYDVVRHLYHHDMWVEESVNAWRTCFSAIGRTVEDVRYHSSTRRKRWGLRHVNPFTPELKKSILPTF